MKWYTFDGYEYIMSDDEDTPPSTTTPLDPQKAGGHDWASTGMAKTWCNKCNAEGRWNMGKVITDTPNCKADSYWYGY